jgi:phosphoadenosine phosphosulfate reductase
MSGGEGTVWRNGGFEADAWVRFAADAVPPADGSPLLVPYAAFVADPQPFLGRNGEIGTLVEPGEAVRALAPHLTRLSLIALAFPKFSDGRNYSAARLLRERLGYRGELRAVGEVLADQIPLMRRCGILSFEVVHAPTRAALVAGRLPEMHHYYQPIPTAPEVPVGTRPWLRRPAA